MNSHEIKRDIDGICEKLRFSNLHDTEKKFKKLVEETVAHELAVDHYEKDVIYSILNLLTTLAYDPIGNLKTKIRNGQDVITFKPASIRVPKKASDAFISSLLKENFKIQRNETDSELSEWTDSDEEAHEDTQSEGSVDEDSSSPSKSLVNTIMPPQKPPVFKTMRIENPETWLRDNIQSSWWTSDISSNSISSSHPSANFCNAWQKHLSDKSLGFIKPRPLSLITEYCLMREIFWMFSNPVDCKFFKFEGDDIVLRPDVSLPSTMPESLQIFLADFLRSINLMHRLKSECIKSYQSSTLSHTLETYYKIVQCILDRIIEVILKEEAIAKAQEQTYTIIILHNKLRLHAKMLEMMWNIHSSSVLDDAKYPPHICATYLLSSLNRHVKMSCNKEKKNLATSLLITCLKTYLEIFEIWWTEARLDDLRSEFLMEKCDEVESKTFQPKLLAKCKEKSFYLNDIISQKITEDSIIDTMLNYAIKASFTLDIISKLDRVHEMRRIVNDSTSLYDEFVKRINFEIERFAVSGKPSEAEKNDQKEEENVLKNRKLIDDIRKGMQANGDEILLLAFESTFERLAQDKPLKMPEASQMERYDRLNEATEFILLPLEHSIQRIINELLQKKISIAERFVMNIYFNEFNIEQYLQDIRRVFFLESNELINFFYVKLFPQMEDSDSSWANPYLLTVALNDAICTNRQQSSTSFRVDVNRKLGHHSVLEAVNELTLFFNVNQNLVNIFTAKSIQRYNQGELNSN